MYCRFLLFFFFILPVFSFGQAPLPITWQHSMGGSLDDIAYDVIETSQHGFVMAGGSTSSDGDLLKVTDALHGGNYDYWIAALDASSGFEWKKHLGGTGSDLASSVVELPEGGYIIGGSSNSFDVDVTGNHGDFDFWILKIVSPGVVEWSKSIGGSLYDDFGSLHLTTDGGIIMCGGSQSNDFDVSGNHGSSDFWLVKTDLNGNIQWQKCYGGSGYEKATDVKQCADGGYILVGFSESTDGDVTVNHGDYDCWVVKTDASGNIQWQQSYGGSNYDDAHSVVQLSNGDFIVCGYTSSNDVNVSGNHGDEDAWMIRLDGTGNLVWSKCLGGTKTDECSSVSAVGDSSLLFSCYSKSGDGDVGTNYGLWDYWLVETDLSGTIKWQQNYGGSLNDVCYAAKPTSDEGIILTGYSESGDHDVSGNHGKRDYWAVKLGGIVGVQEPETVIEPVTVYPQPAAVSFSIDIPSSIFLNHHSLSAKFFDASGRMIKMFSSITGSPLKVNENNWDAGIYFFEIYDDDQRLYRGKVAIQ
jgi:hypothetical protein